MSGLEQDFDFVTFQHSQHPPPSALLVFRAGAEADYYFFFPRVLGLTEFPELGMPDFSEPSWGQKLSARGGKNAKKRAVVAVARKLAVLLHRLWVSGEVYEPLRNSHKAMSTAA